MVEAIFFIDLKNAFDEVSNNVLLSKLSTHNVSENTEEWMASYLKDRQHCMDVSMYFWLEEVISKITEKGQRLQVVQHVKYLGVIVDRNLILLQTYSKTPPPKETQHITFLNLDE